MEFPFGVTVTRERRRPITDPYNPAATIPGAWDDPLDIITLEGASILTTSSVAPLDATRVQRLTNKSLYLTDPDADVRAGDRVTDGQVVYYVNARPDADMNPFTAWRPVVRIPLDLTEG